ncbi:MAG: helix-turn-helix domain-containing protein [Desulfobacteraceae bacterium]|nr:helix-turn-helix domain-containing protein [Desulfobacteraceae bacterium]MBC2748832.1 helix-turn-helix domain-containing protein [Desulfobacteraceae bacterium]
MVSQAYFSTEQAATYIGLSRRTLEGFRCRGGGPVFIKAGRRCLYRREDLDTWAMSRRCESTSDPNYSAQ